ncbi:MAG: PD40 domain-containing protein, partial [Actinobacteria bacterium]|nr:PD40 domain-containing protein [Actinomycetota bacterium]
MTLSASPDAGWSFDGWGGACSGSGACSVDVRRKPESVSASFSRDPITTFTLSVTKQGSGGGTVTSANAAISCGGTCSSSYSPGSKTTLTAAPAADSRFSGWGGACASATGPKCTLTVNGNTTASARFDLRLIAFASAREGNPELYSLRPDGNAESRITREASIDEHPTWSPDGR